jgi:putative hydrolase of the HAD superfamily
MIQKTIVFDLDDTLINEIDYLESSFKDIANYLDANDIGLFEDMLGWYKNNENVFLKLESKFKNISILDLKKRYRNHFPNFNPNSKNKELLIELKKEGHFLGLITDGFSITQRNKLKALDIEHIFDLIIISEEFGSEKPTEDNFTIFKKFNTYTYYYIGDNFYKDFITPNRLGWITIGLIDNGKNIHKQNYNVDINYLPKITIKELTELKKILK